MERVNTSSVRGFLRSYDDLTEKIRCLIQKKLIKKYLSSWRRTTGRLEDTVEELQNKYGEKTALKRIKSIVKKIRKKNIKHGAHSGNMTNQQPNNTNNNNSTSFGQPLIQNPNQVNLTIDQRNGGSIFAPIMVEKTIYGDVNFNVVSHSTSVNEHEILPNVRNEMKSRMLRDAERTLEGSAAQSVSLNKIYTELFIISDETDPINRQHEIWQIEMTHNLNTSAQRLINYKEILQPPTDENIIVW